MTASKGKAREGSEEGMIRQMEEMNLRLLDEFRSQDATSESRGYTVPSGFDLRTMPLDEPPPPDLVSTVFSTQPQYCHRLETVECILHSAAAKQELVEYPGFPQPITRPKSTPYRIVEIPSKGLGLVATQDIALSDFIASERPLLIEPRTRSMADYMEFSPNATIQQKQHGVLSELEKIYRIAFERMEPEHKETFMKLHNSHLDDGSGPILGIVRTNAYGLCDLEGRTYSGVFRDISRINHSCRPNTTLHFHRASLSMLVFAVRDIKEGEEITSSYCHPLEPHAARQKALEPYGIHCDCQACINRIESDTNRLRISHVKDAIPAIIKWAENPNLPDDLLLAPSLVMLQLIEAEGLETSPAYFQVLYHLIHILTVLSRWELDSRLVVYSEKWMKLRACGFEVEGHSKEKYEEERQQVIVAASTRPHPGARKEEVVK